MAAALVLAALASACAQDESAAPLLTTTTDREHAERTDIAWLFEPIFEQVDCPDHITRDGLACGIVELLLDPDDATAGTIGISIATLSGSDAGSGAIAVLQGGPGGASTDLAGWVPRQPFTQVFIDQRGTGFTKVDLDCPEYDVVLPQLLTLELPKADAARDAALAACAERLADEPLLEHADSALHADDVMTVMLGLGHVDEWYAYGVSYGTTIAMELLREVRPGLAGVVLDGVYPIWLDLDRAIAESAQSSINAIATACAASAECSTTTDDFAALLDRTVAKLDGQPMVVPLAQGENGFGFDVTVRLDGRRLAELTFLLLYSEQTIAGLPGAIAGIEVGDGNAARWLTATGSRMLASVHDANNEGSFFAVQCAERLDQAGGVDATIDGFSGAIVTTALDESCAAWPVTRQATPGPIFSNLPVLLLSGTFDPITPPAYAEAVAESLSNSTLVTQGGRSHGIWIGNNCVQGIVAAFIKDGGAAPAIDCADQPTPVDWFTPG
jgi:pimeloyl-ACP methyl ester carboxylesterase